MSIVANQHLAGRLSFAVVSATQSLSLATYFRTVYKIQAKVLCPYYYHVWCNLYYSWVHARSILLWNISGFFLFRLCCWYASDSSGSNEATVFQVRCCYFVPSRDFAAFQFHDMFMYDVKIDTFVPDLISSWSTFKRFEHSFVSTSRLKASSNSTLCLSSYNSR